MKRVLTALLACALWASAAGAQPKTDKERAGLRGPVKTLTTEVAEFAAQGGGGAEGRRVRVHAVTYDPLGNKTEQVEFSHDGSVAQRLVYTYDAQGRNTGYEEYTSGLSIPRRHAYVLDEGGRRVEYRIVQPDGSAGEKYLYKYDRKGKLAEEVLHDHKGKLISRKVYAYDGRGREISQTRYDADGSVSSVGGISYDAKGRPAERVRHEGGILTYRIRYSYDSKGRVVGQEIVGSVVDADVPPSEPRAAGRLSYVYKGEKRPAEATASAPDGSPRESVVFEYDSRGNWIKKTYFSPPAGGAGRGDSRRAEYRTITYF